MLYTGMLWAVMHVHGASTVAFQMHFVLMMFYSFYLFRGATRFYARHCILSLRMRIVLPLGIMFVPLSFKPLGSNCSLRDYEGS